MDWKEQYDRLLEQSHIQIGEAYYDMNRNYVKLRADVDVAFTSGADAVARLANNPLSVGRDDYWYRKAIEELAELRAICMGLIKTADIACEGFEDWLFGYGFEEEISHDVR